MRKNQALVDKEGCNAIKLRVPQRNEHFQERPRNASRDYTNYLSEDPELQRGFAGAGWPLLLRLNRPPGRNQIHSHKLTRSCLTFSRYWTNSLQSRSWRLQRRCSLSGASRFSRPGSESTQSYCHCLLSKTPPRVKHVFNEGSAL